MKGDRLALTNVDGEKLDELLDAISAAETQKLRDERAAAKETAAQDAEAERKTAKDERQKRRDAGEEVTDSENEEQPDADAQDEPQDAEESGIEFTATLDNLAELSKESQDQFLEFVLARPNQLERTSLTTIWDNLGEFMVREDVLATLLRVLMEVTLLPASD
jgi:hypothetical protein